MSDPDAARLRWVERQADLHDLEPQPDAEHDRLDWEDR